MAETCNFRASSVWLSCNRSRNRSILAAQSGRPLETVCNGLDTNNASVIFVSTVNQRKSQQTVVIGRGSPSVTKHRNKEPELRRYHLYRGLYARIARTLGVDRSYVSRVARGERRSPEIEAALRAELKRIERG